MEKKFDGSTLVLFLNISHEWYVIIEWCRTSWTRGSHSHNSRYAIENTSRKKRNEKRERKKRIQSWLIDGGTRMHEDSRYIRPSGEFRECRFPRSISRTVERVQEKRLFIDENKSTKCRLRYARESEERLWYIIRR